MWLQILNRLKELGTYEWGVLVIWEGETRLYSNGNFWESSYAYLLGDINTITVNDLFPANPER